MVEEIERERKRLGGDWIVVQAVYTRYSVISLPSKNCHNFSNTDGAHWYCMGRLCQFRYVRAEVIPQVTFKY